MNQKAWIISVSMGYGHQRTAYPLRGLAPEEKIINANDYPGIPEKDRRIWERTRRFYESISRFKRTPLIGDFLFSIYDNFQKIPQYYPRRDLSKPTLTLKTSFSLIKKGWGKHLIDNLKLQNANLPIISTFFTPAFMAEFFNYPGEIYCVACDADISRTWAPLKSEKSKIKYFAPTERVVERLKLYGVRPENIFLTGYPLPLENISSKNLEILKEDLRYRILNLDPQKRYFKKYKTLIEENLGKLPEKSDHPLTLMFSVGGAGAQKEIATKILRCLRFHLKQGEIRIILSAGIREKVKEYFKENIRNLSLTEFARGRVSGNSEKLGTDLCKNYRLQPSLHPPRPFKERAGYLAQTSVIFGKDIEDYFQKFNQALRKTDILWTKPSELSFYSALGIPIIVAPPIGSQEEFNMRWLLKSGFGISQENPAQADQWLFDWLEKGYLAEAAMEGFIEGEKRGTLNIKNIISQTG